jgi:hypothetical protein
LGQAYDAIEDYGRAMSTYHEAHKLAQVAPFDRAAYAAETDLRIDAFSKELMETPDDRAFTSELPILIVGVIRSGTTLTDQVLTSHPQVGGAGELGFWGSREHLAFRGSSHKVDQAQATSLAREYCRILKSVGVSFARITDKQPSNCMRLGLIHLALPNARIIHMKRSPLDTCISIYRMFSPNGSGFPHLPEDLVFVYREYERLMEHWRRVLPADRFMEVHYEELAQDPEPIVRKMLAFCGLDWDPSCLHPELNAKLVKTPSAWQVRQGFYTTSIGRWKNYEHSLGPFQELLEPSGPN